MIYDSILWTPDEKGHPVLRVRIILSLQEEPLFNAGLKKVYSYVDYKVIFIYGKASVMGLNIELWKKDFYFVAQLSLFKKKRFNACLLFAYFISFNLTVCLNKGRTSLEECLAACDTIRKHLGLLYVVFFSV